MNKIFKIVRIIDLKRMFPNLPTDSFYKFFFVGCLFLIGLLVYSRQKENERITESFDKYNIENIRQDIQYKNLQEDYKQLNKEIEILKSVERVYYLRIKDSLKYKADIYAGKLGVFKENDFVLKQNLNKVSALKNEFNNSKIIYNIYLIILSVLALTSGGLWFFRLQIYQDKIIKEDLRIKKNER